MTRATGRPVSKARAPARAVRSWARLTDEELLQMRFCDLKLAIERSPLKHYVRRLYADLERRGISLRPHVWLSEEWFSPDGVPGIAIPFYLAHPRLERLERRIMREAEGGNSRLLMRILRHEAGHALDNAYRLRRRRRWRAVFGPASRPYPARYRARAGSRRYVHHLGEWYAQAHPTEDFAETFAVWLKPRSAWRRDYNGWPAFGKLEFIDGLMRDLGGTRPRIQERDTVEEVTHENRTLRQHYEYKLARYRMPRRSGADELLLKVFTTAPRNRAAPRAATLLRELRNPLRQRMVRSGGFSEYLVHQVLRLIIERCEKLNLFVRGPRRELVTHLVWVIARLAESYEERQLPRVAL